MRTISYFTFKPEAIKTATVDDRVSVFYRTHIQPETITDEEGNEHTQWSAIEYSTQVNALKFEATQEFCDHLVEIETEAEAKRVRAIRNTLLDKTDKEMTVDRIEREDPEKVEAWKAYRQALRDIPEQEGFPFDVIWPVKP